MFEVMTEALKFFRMMAASAQDRRQFISSLAKEHQASHERFKQMASVAFDDSAIESLKAKLSELGFTEIKASVIYTKDDILAWGLSADKMPA
jgi:hypothetical protein